MSVTIKIELLDDDAILFSTLDSNGEVVYRSSTSSWNNDCLIGMAVRDALDRFGDNRG